MTRIKFMLVAQIGIVLITAAVATKFDSPLAALVILVVLEVLTLFWYEVIFSRMPDSGW